MIRFLCGPFLKSVLNLLQYCFCFMFCFIFLARRYVGFPSGSDGKESACSAGDAGNVGNVGSIPGWGARVPHVRC